MCIIVDINVLVNVFNKDSVRHDEFKPVFEWIFKGKGTVVYGGSSFINELGKTKYIKLFGELRKMQKAIVVDATSVDIMERVVKDRIDDKDFDDPHLVALLIVSGCKLICSADQRAYKYFRSNIFFNPADKRPRIYRGSSNSSLLKDKNIANICIPCIVINNAQRELITSVKT